VVPVECVLASGAPKKRQAAGYDCGMLEASPQMSLPIAALNEPQIRSAVDQVVSELADDVVLIRYDMGLDWTGDRSIFFRVLLKNKASRGKRLARATSRASALLREKMRAIPLDLLVYFSFRSQEEQKSLRDEAWV
jgi:hypothetical protein